MKREALRVLFVSLTEHLNGAERVMLDCARCVDPARVHAIVAVPAEGAVSEAARRHGLDTCIVRAPRWLPFAHDPAPASYHWRRYWANASAYVDPLVAIISKRRVDVVYSCSATILHGALAASISGRPHVHHLQEILGDVNLGLVMPRGDARLAYRILSMLASRVVFICDASLRDAGGAVPSGKRRLAPLGFPPAVRVEQPLPLPAGDRASVRVGIIAGVWPLKGTNVIAPVVQRVVARMPDTHFYWAGPGDSATMHRLAKHATVNGRQNLHFLDYLDDVEPFLASIDLLLHPSRSECFPRVIAEAALAGRPAVATRCGGTDEIIGDGRSGVLVPVDDVEGLANGVLRLARDAELARRMGQAAAARHAGLTLERFATSMQEVFFDAYRAGPPSAAATRRVVSLVLRSGSQVVPAARAIRAAWGGRA
jgi:glycosyltransferase involved in cell wall biosynthesis